MAGRLWIGGLCVLAGWAATAAWADNAAVERGRYLARVGDCIACHTAENGADFAGGRPMVTPIGTVYTTNITPDPETGIGGYDLADFTRALRDGIAKDGHHLYPAMPFPSYAKVTDDDMAALFDYFRHSVVAVKQANRNTDIPFPLGLRFPLMAWDAAFLRSGTYQPDTNRDQTWNRGAYLVQGLGHCGTCHTPRAVTLQEKALDDRDGSDFLSGAIIDGWYAKSLRGGMDGLGSWSESDIATFLKTGGTDRTAAFAPMAEVVQHSTQYLNDDDLSAIAQYLKTLSSSTAKAPAPTVSPTPSDDRGALGYAQFCQTCHRADGGGVPRIFPALAGNSVVRTGDATSLIRIVLAGGRRPHTAARPTAYAMPGFRHLSDGDVAEIVTFIRSAWDNGGDAVTPRQVAAIRASLSEPETRKHDAPIGMVAFAPPRAADIPAGEAGRDIRRGRLLLTETGRYLPDNVGDSLNCTSCHLNAGTVAGAGPFFGSAPTYPRDNPRAGRPLTLEERINGCLQRSMNGTPLPADSADLKAMIAYFNWLSAGIPKDAKVEGRGIGSINKDLIPDPVRGKVIYGQQCAECHGLTGEGIRNAKGDAIIPPLWGDQSFNIGAGMARTFTAAAFIKGNMPVAHGLNPPLSQGGALTDQEAVDVAEYVTHQPRPDFAPKVNDWPNGGRPKDARY